jgi:hypothetical protein
MMGNDNNGTTLYYYSTTRRVVGWQNLCKLRATVLL